MQTYLTQDVIASVDTQLKTLTDAKHRGIAGYSMGDYCALNLGSTHPDLFSVVLDYSGEPVSKPDMLSNQELYGGSDWQQQADANSPAAYVSKLDGSKGPAVWLDCGTGDPGSVEKMPQLKARGSTVEIHSRPGAHDATTWVPALNDSMVWAWQRMG